MSIPLEDNFADVVGKAQRGLGIPDRELAAHAGISVVDLTEVKAEHYDEVVLRKIAPILKLDANALTALPRYYPHAVEVTGLISFSTAYGSMLVNSYLVWDTKGSDAVAFDTGTDCTAMCELLHSKELKLRGIFLTHTHGDHIADLDRLRDETGAPVFVSERESLPGAKTFEEGKEFKFGNLRVETRQTWGHSRGGTTYVVHGLERLLAVVGDALFAGSMGGGMVSYADALRTNREEILSLAPETVLCPGHGPLTTVGEEREHNPFFA